ncbi:MAG: sigma-70 family RNA polymerase sigma factor [Chloroflexi bacterium]|nr:sigma-70 family RNA polymerase sigma factor [Chloroflexota bacterium]
MKGEPEAFNSLVERYQARVYNLALRMLRDPAAAEDVTQDAFLAAFRSIGKFRGGSFPAWLFRIATNLCHDVGRQARSGVPLSLEAMTVDLPSTPTREDSPEEHLLARETQEEVHRGLQLLPKDQRLVVIMVDLQGWSYEEVAQLTRSALGTVKSRISRARDKLKEYLVSQEQSPRKSRL